MAQKKQSLPRLASVVQAWMDIEEWEDEIIFNDEATSSRVVTGYEINGQSHKLYIHTDEEDSQFFVYMYSPYKVPPKKMPEMATLLNTINIVSYNAGRLACYDDDDSNPVQFMWKIPVADSELTTDQVGIAVHAAVQVFDIFGELLAQCVFTNKSAKEIWAEHLAAREAAEQEAAGGVADDDVPAEL